MEFIKVTSIVTKYEDRENYPYFWTIFVWQDDRWKLSGFGNWAMTPENAREEIVITMAQYNMREVYIRSECDV